MKKIFSLILSIILSLSLCTSCAPKTQEAELSLGFYQSSKAAEYGEFRYIGITLSEDNKCEISFSMTGDFFYGTYTVEKDSLICKLTRLQGEYIETLETDIEYHFNIIDEKTIEFEKVVGKVGKYKSTIDKTEYDFETQLSHFEKGETFVYYIEESTSDVSDDSSKAEASNDESLSSEPPKPVSSKPTSSSSASEETIVFPEPVVISHSGTIVKGGVYTVGNEYNNEKIVTYTAGQKMPAKCNDYDTYTFGDYKYSYFNNHFEYECAGWKVEVLDKNKEKYGPILTSINNMPVVSLFYTFDGCKNMKVAPAIPKEVITIDIAFRGCSSLKVAPIIPDKVTRLSETFKDCTSLETVTQFPKKLTALEYSFENCKMLKSVSAIPDSVTNLSYTFKGCESLTKAPKMPDGVLYMIGTFYDCKNLKEISSIPSKVQRFGATFKNCSSLKSVPKFPTKVVQFEYMFEGCTMLETVVNFPQIEPEVVSYPGFGVNNQISGPSFYKMFYGCTSLKSVPAIPDGVESIESAFENCSSLVSAPKLPDSIKSMSAAFKNCTSLKTAPVIPKRVYYMVSTFEGCKALTGEVVVNTEYNALEGDSVVGKCFYNTIQPIKIVGKANSWVKKQLAETANKNNVTCDEEFSFD